MPRAILMLLLVLFCGCSWSPSRDNPADPSSPYYEPPPIPNRSPSVDTLFVVTDCLKDPLANVCAFEARCRVSDPDENVQYDSVMAQLDTLPPWKMSYDAGAGYFVVRRSQRDLPSGRLDTYRFRPFAVTVVDDSGAFATRVISFPEEQTEFPTPDYPLGEANEPDTVWSGVATVSWRPWTNFGEPHSYSISLYWFESTLVWDSSGIAPVDTPLVIGEPLEPNTPVENLYKWYLTLTDARGNRMTYEPQYFVAYPGAPLVRRRPETMADQNP